MRELLEAAFMMAIGAAIGWAVREARTEPPEPIIVERVDTLYQPCPNGTLTWEHPTADSTGTIKMFVCPNEEER